MAEDDTGGSDPILPESLLPYDQWIEQAYRGVMVRALENVSADGLPGGHHFYLTFRTDDPQTVIPKRMLAQYPSEMTIVLQHQFWDLKVDHEAQAVSVGLSFGNVPTTLVVPLRAVTAFADPHVRLALRFSATTPEAAEMEPVAGTPADAAATEPAAEAGQAADRGSEPSRPDPDATPQVVSLDAFRKRSNPS